MISSLWVAVIMGNTVSDCVELAKGNTVDLIIPGRSAHGWLGGILCEAVTVVIFLAMDSICGRLDQPCRA